MIILDTTTTGRRYVKSNAKKKNRTSDYTYQVFFELLILHTEPDENGLAIIKKSWVCMPSRGPIQHLLDSLILFH